MVEGQTDKAVVWVATATGGILAATAIYWVLQKALDAYVPYQVRPGPVVHASDTQPRPASQGPAGLHKETVHSQQVSLADTSGL